MSDSSSTPRLGRLELAALAALLMAMTALAIDIMIPALSDMSSTFALTEPNDRQLTVTAYMVGLAIGQLAYGPLADRYGRRPVLLAAIAIYVAASLACAAAPAFDTLLMMRAVQGLGGAGGRVVAMAIVRDLTSGRRMAEVLSLAGTIFLAAPIFAPSLGQLILFVVPWPGVFVTLAVIGAALAVWVAARAPETLPPERRRPLQLRSVAATYVDAMRPPASLGYTLAFALVMGGLLGFISSAEQVFVDAFGMGRAFTLAFAIIASAAAVSTLLNAGLVSRWGMRRLSHVALIAFVAINAAHAVIIAGGWQSAAIFTALMAATWFTIGFLGGNFQALAMEPLGHIAGVGSAAIGFTSTFIGAGLGALIGRAYDGTTGPLVYGTTLVGAAALMVVFVTERGRLFQASNESADGPDR